MPGSIRENDQFVREFVANNNIQNVLDVGVGQGTYSDLIRNQVTAIDGIEVWEPYVEQFDLVSKYDALYVADARSKLKEFVGPYKVFDLVIFGDVLEHMTEDEAKNLWDVAGMISRWGLISVPIVHYPQGAEGGNPYEVHVQEHLTPEHIRAKFGPFIKEALYPWTGTFIREF